MDSFGIMQIALDGPGARSYPTLPGLFAGDPPDEFPLLNKMAADVRPETLSVQLSLMGGSSISARFYRCGRPGLSGANSIHARRSASCTN
jgi:hypothetical protein